MRKLKKQIIAFIKCEAGVTAIEYSLIAGATSIVILGALGTIGSSLNTRWTAISTALLLP